MSQPQPYAITTSFADDEANAVSGRSTVRTAALDTELANIQTTADELCTNLSLIQRDDGGLMDQTVSVVSLSPAVLALIGSAGFTVNNPLGWLTTTAYPARTIVTHGTGTYVSAVAHTSGVFATDVAAGKWATLFDTAVFSATAITFTPAGTIAATNVQAAIEEVATEAADSANVNFIQSGTGAVSIPVRTKLRQCIDVADFDTVQHAVNAAIANGVNTITAFGGTHTITTAVECTASIEWLWFGEATLKALAPFVAITVGSISECVMIHLQADNSKVQGVIIDCDNLTGPSGFVGVWADVAADYAEIRSCTFKNIYYYGGGFVSAAVNFRFNNYSRVEGCTFLHCAAGPQTQGGRNVVFADNDYISRTAGVRDTAFGMDGGISCQILNNRIQYENGTGSITSIIGVTSGATKFLVQGNIITGQNSGYGINIDKIGAAGVDTGIVSNNTFDGVSVAGLSTYINIRMAVGSSGVLIQGNTFSAGATGVGSSVCIQPTANANVVRGNTINVSGVQAAILTISDGGFLDIIDNFIQTDSICVLVDAGTNSGKKTWVKRNQFYLAAVAIKMNGVAVEANTPMYMQDNEFNNVVTTNPVQGTRWDVGFKAASDGGRHPHYCGVYTEMYSAAVPDATWQTGGGSFQKGDVFKNAAAASGATPGWVCTTAGTAGGTGVFKAMANLA